MKKRNRKRIILIAAAITLMYAMCATMANAYFSDYETAIGRARIDLSGSTTINEEWKDKTKTVTIQNTGETDVVVRVGIYGPDGMDVTGTDGWTKDGDFWYYDQVLPPGISTSNLTATVEKVPVSEDYNEFDIIVVQECIPYPVIAAEKEGIGTGIPSDWNLGLTPAKSESNR